MRKLLIIMTVVFGLCFSILGNAKKLNLEDSKKILLKGEVIGSGAQTGFVKIVLKYKKKIYICAVGNLKSIVCATD